jgi:DNA helicase-2/ATP-dependent DNA helicase PcrA
MRTWSQYQLAIFDFVKNPAGLNGKRNAIVKAVAGSGKSTTLVEAIRNVNGSSIFLAFNKSIADELKARGVNARTFHSLTFSTVLRHKRQSSVEQNKLRKLCDANMTGDDVNMYGGFIVRLVGLARNAGIGCLELDTVENWQAIIEHHDLELDSEHAKIERAIELARNLLAWSNASPLVDFDDMLYVAVRDGLTLPKFDFVFVDEAQDTNAIQRAILRKIMHKGSRLVAVGDPAQAIYGFRGSDSNSLQQIAEEFDCAELPLTVSYRCPQSVVKYAQQWVAHIEAAPNAAEGKVTSLGQGWNTANFAAGDLVVCRTTKPLVAMAYSLIRARVPARIMGKEIGKSLATLVKKMNAKGIDKLIEKLQAYTKREVEKCIAKRQETKAEQIQDKTDALLVIIDSLPKTDRTVPALLQAIEDLFADVRAAVTLATIHKAKGLEAERVYWLNRSQCPSSRARQPWQQEQERNLCYVAATRAKAELVLIEEKADEQREAA